MENSVEINNLQKRLKDFEIKNISLCVPRGSVVGLIGENGAGKSTTIKCILGLMRADAGSIKVFGKSASMLTRTEKNRIGAVLGETCLPENFTLRDINDVMKHIFSNWSESLFFGYATQFSLPKDQKVREFSRGMRQKLSLAIALSHGAELLILDEPTSGLDPVARDEILDMLYDFMQDERNSVLISSHIVSDLEKLCDYIVFIHEGAIIFEEEKDVLYEKYGILKCSEQELFSLDPSSIVAYRRGEFGAGALVLREKVPANLFLERASIEDIMLYYLRGERTTNTCGIKGVRKCSV